MNLTNSEKEIRIPFHGLFHGSFKNLLIFLFVLTGIRLIVMAFSGLNLAGDEAHYWEWSRQLDWCYYSKPPGVAFLIYLGRHLFGNTEIGVRCLAVVFSMLSSLVMYLLGKRLYDEKVGIASAVLLQFMPLFSAYGIGMTPDTPLVFFWILSLYLMHKAWSDNKSADWLMLSGSLGLALLCKYAIVFFYIPAILFLVTSKLGRKRLRSVWPYLSFLLSFAFFIPVLYWNSRHDWVMFRHDIAHANMDEQMIFSLKDLAMFIVTQLGVVTPIACVIILILLIRNRKKCAFCFWFSIPILIGFLLKSTQGKIQGNWPMTAWITGLFPLADAIVNQYPSLKKVHKEWLNWAIVIPAYAAIAIHIVPFAVTYAPWPENNNPVRKITGWRELGKAITPIAQSMEEPYFIFADYYMTASSLAFYIEGNPHVYCVNIGSRMTQYDIWPGIETRIGENAIYVMELPHEEEKAKARTLHPRIEEAFERIEGEDLVIKSRYGKVIHRFRVYRCYNLKKWEREMPNSY